MCKQITAFLNLEQWDACAWKELINFWSFKGIYNEQLSVHITQVILGQINYSKGDKV